ncbi:hypothetical protein [Paracraurococcus lichenis]|uniref:Uncharacterized protein n=1 Tax=Paracraurococcus lichenis TaxID=3064888 RepID=A0ABT9EAF6_9PROT|nr:hypothetical protein [Paracraurococcus sp. LOR1-02]MDO9713163.1 hypothetical protein [Paracraurococcus sp. LOR1-02]
MRTNFPDADEAFALLEQRGYPARLVNANQIKIGRVSYYPTTGTVYRDGALKPLPRRGFASLEWYLGKHTYLY